MTDDDSTKSSSGTKTDDDCAEDELARSRTKQGVSELPLRSRDRYELLGEHARGGIGTITKARDRELGRSLVIKEIQTPHAAAIERFVREAQITMRLEHPSIVPVHDAGRWESGEPFYAMKHVSGRTLKDVVLAMTSLAERMTLLPNIIAVVDAIAYAHDQHVIHRDLKASNVIVGAFGETIVIDWGLAKDVSAPDAPAETSAGPYRKRADTTVMGAVVGTPSSMSPEQARGEDVDYRADVYSLGALLYFTMSGHAPHEGVDADDVLAAARSRTPKPIVENAPGIALDLAAIIGKAMAADKSARYPNAQELALDLKRFQAGQIVAAHRYSLLDLATRWIRRHRAIATATSIFVVVSAVGLFAFGVRENRLRGLAEVERDRANQKTLALLEQQGRAELTAGHPFRAATYLSDALRRDPKSLTLRSLLTQAIRPMDSRVRVLEGHTHDVTTVFYSHDGARIVTASSDKTVRIWSADTGALVRSLPHDADVDSADFSRDGKLVVSGALDHQIRIWNADTGALVHKFDDANPYRVAFTPDDSGIVVGTQSGELRVRDAATGEIRFSAAPHKDRVQQIAFSPDDRTMVIPSFDGSVSFWDARTFALLRVLKDHDGGVSSVAFSHDGRRIVTAESDVYLHVRDAETGARLYSIRMPEGARWPTVSFSSDDRTLVTASHDGIVRVWHAASGALLSSVDAQPTGKLMASALRPQSGELVTAGSLGQVAVWKTNAQGYRLFDWPTGRDENVYPAEFSRDGRHVIAGGTRGTVTEWDADSGRIEHSFDVPGEAFSVAANRDGSHILASGTIKAAFPPAIWDATSGQRVAPIIGHTKMIYTVATSADGATFATASYDGTVRFFDSSRGDARGVLEIGNERVPAMAFDPNGKEIAAVTEAGKLLFIDRASGVVRRVVDAHHTWIQDVEYSRDGARVVTAGRQDHTVHVWNVASGGLELTLEGHRDNVMHASFSADDRFIATAGVDHVAYVWDAHTGALLRTILGADFGAVFSADDKELVTTGQHGFVVAWDTTVDPRAPDALAKIVAEQSPWHLVDGRLELLPQR